MVNRSDLEVNINGRDNLSPDLQRIESRLIRFVGAVSSALTAVRVASFPVNAVREFEKEMANVQKTTNFTDRQIKQLGAGLVKFSRDLTTTAPELAKIAAAAGQQGLGREGVKGVEAFTESVARMSAVLDVTVEQAGANIGKISSIFNIALSDTERVVSAFNEASNNSTASGEELLDVVKRIGNAAGTLKVDQAIAVAATGIDLGLSREVSGTSFSKIFSEMFSQADEFARLLGVSTADWMKTLQKGGVDALKAYLAGLRKLSQEDQQKWIKALSGGGRIGVLVTKLLQDANDAILDRNLGFSAKGFEDGTSAIKEQQTVLATLDAEIQKTKNSFNALGIAAGEQFGGELATFFAQLNAGLANDDVIAFAEAMGRTFLDIFEFIADGIKVLASLNINWQNFITLAKGLLLLKIASFFANKLAAVSNLATAYRVAGASAAAGAQAEAAAAAASSKSLRAQRIEIQNLILARAQYKKAIAEQARLEVLAAEQSRALNLAAARDQAARTALARATTVITSSNPQIAAARAATVAAEKAAGDAVAKLRAQHQAKIIAAEQAHQARLQLIATEYAAKRQAANAIGSKKLLREAQAAQAAQKLQEDAFYTRSLRSTEAYYKRKVLITQAAGVAQVTAAKAAFAASLTRFDTVVAQQNLTGLQAHLTATGTRLQFVNKQLDGTLVRLNALRASTASAVTGLKALQLGLAALGRTLSLLIGWLAKIFFWVTLVVLVLDMTGLMDNVGRSFTKFTDTLGLTSEASRKLARENENLAERLKESAEAAKEAEDAFESYLNKIDRKIDEGVTTKLLLNFQDPDREVVQEAVKQYGDMLDLASDRIARNVQQQASLPSATLAAEAQLEAARESLKEHLEKVASIEDAINRQTPGTLRPDSFLVVSLEEENAKIEEQKKKVKELEDSLKTMGGTGAEAIKKNIAETDEFNKALDEVTRKTQTAMSAEVISRFAPELINQRVLVDELKEAYAELAKKAGSASEGAGKEAAKAARDAAQVQLTEATRGLAELEQRIAEFIYKRKTGGDLTTAMLGSIDNLPTVFARSNSQLQGILLSLERIKKAGLVITGENAPLPITPNSGDGKLDAKAEARKLSKARIDLRRAELQAIANLEKQANKEQSAELENAFSLSLVSIREYYAERQRLQESNLDIELKEKRAELSALESETSEQITKADKIRSQASRVRVQGEIDLMLAQRDALARETEIDLQKAFTRFADEVVAQEMSLLSFFGSMDNTRIFEAALADAAAAHRGTLLQMEAEAREHPELLPLIDSLKLKIELEAVEAVFHNLGRQANIVNQQADNVDRRLSLLQENGFLTFNEYAALLEDARKKQAAQLEAQIKEEEKYLEKVKAQNDALGTQDLIIKEITNSIEARRVELDQLRIEGNLVAKELNEELHGALSSFLSELAHGKDISEALTDFGLRLLDSLVDNAADNLATTLQQALGSTGTGGFGGMFAELLGAGGERGTELLPMVVRQAATDKGIDAAKDATKDVTADVLGGGSTLGDVGDKVEKSGEGVLSGIWGIGSDIVGGVGDGLSSLGSLLATLFGTLTAAIFSQSAANSGSSLISMIGSGASAAAVAHGGGVVGHLTQSRTGVNPAVFANAMRYHGGGMPGMSKDEVAAILLKGEEVLTRDDPRNVLNGGKGGATGGGNNTPILKQRLLPILDPDLISEALRGAQGEELVELIISRNPGKFNSLLNRG